MTSTSRAGGHRGFRQWRDSSRTARDLSPADTLHYQVPAFIDLRNASGSYSLSIRTLKRMIARGLPAYRSGPGGKLLIRPSDLEAFLVRASKPEVNLDALVDEIYGELRKGKGRK